jgi:hypothetical protein
MGRKVGQAENEPQIFDEPGQYGGCPGVESIALDSDYLSKGEPFVRAFFAALRDNYEPTEVDSQPAISSERYHALVKRLVSPTSQTTERMTRYCDSPPDAGAD